MRSRIFLLVLVFLVFSLQAYAREFEIIQITDGTQKFRNPVWSPDGTKLAFWGPGGIYIAKADGTEQPLKIFNTFGEFLRWVSDSELVYWQRKFIEVRVGEKSKKERRESLRVVNLNGQERIIEEGSRASAPHRLKDGLIAYKRDGEYYDFVKHQKINPEILKKQLTVIAHSLDVYDLATKKPKYNDTDIWITSIDGTFEKRVTYGKEYWYPQLSNDGTRILAKKPDFGLVLIDLNGEEKRLIEGSGYVIEPGIYKGIAGCLARWSPNDSLIVYVESKETGEYILGSEIFITPQEGEKIQLTNTPEEIETDPEWSSDGTKIACYSDNTGKIFVINLK